MGPGEDAVRGASHRIEVGTLARFDQRFLGTVQFEQDTRQDLFSELESQFPWDAAIPYQVACIASFQVDETRASVRCLDVFV